MAIMFGQIMAHSIMPTDVGTTVTFTSSTGNAVRGTIGSNGYCIVKLPAFERYTVTTSKGFTSTPIELGCGENHFIEVGLSKTTPAGIKQILNAGLETTYFNVGDQLTFKENGADALFDVLHVDYRTGVYGRNIILGRHNCLNSAMQMQTNNTNAGGYKATIVARYLDSDYYNNLQEDLKAVIEKYVFQASVGSQSQSLQNEEHYVWLPTEWNIFGATTYAAPTEKNTGGAEQFAYFATAANRVKTVNGAAAGWWECSPNVSSSAHFCYVSSDGSPNSGNASYSIGVLPCFMIAADH